MPFALPLVVLLQAAPSPAAELPSAHPPARRAGFYGELSIGIASGSAPTTPSEVSIMGFLARPYVAFTFPIGDRWRLGPAFGSGLSMSVMTDAEGERSSVVYGQTSVSALVEVAVADIWSLGVAPGLGWAVTSGGSFLGPELGVSLRQRRPLADSNQAAGTVFRLSAMPWFPLSTPTTGPGFSWMLSWGFGFGVDERAKTPLGRN